MENSQSLNELIPGRHWAFAIAMAILTLLFAVPLYHWARLALSVDLQSHVILIPFVSGFLIWRRRRELTQSSSGSWGVASLFALGALVLVWTYWRRGDGMAPQDSIALAVGAYVLMAVAAGFACFGVSVMRVMVFPVCLLFFMVPIFSGFEVLLERVLQRFSADAAHLLFWAFGETYLRDGQVFLLPGLTIEVAQECSGIRSSFVLFILSLVAGHVMLRSNWHRAILVFAVLPLGILRNGIRVYVITALTLHVDPGIIDSPLHHRGGPLFFALSLVPFGALLWYLWRREQRSGKLKSPGTPS